MSRKSKALRFYDENNNLISKQCTTCGQVKNIEEFSKNKKLSDGYMCRCKECVSKKSLECQHRKYENDPDYYKKRNDKYRNKINERAKDRYWNRGDKERKSKYKKELNNKLAKQEIDRIKHNYTNLLYPHCGTQYGVIYKVQNIKNLKTYIGQTTKSFNLRYEGNFFTNKLKEIKNEELKADFYQDLEIFGIGGFMIQEVIDVAFSPMELDEKEVYWIDYYNAYEEGYNSNRGFYNGRTTVYNRWIEEHPEYEEYKNIFGVYLLEE